MTHKATVLGCGLVGATMARDLAWLGEFEVTAADVKVENLRRLAGTASLKTLQTDLSNPARIREVVADADVVLGALPSSLGFATLKAVIETGKSYCDISFMVENPLDLNELAVQNGVTAVVDCGVSPGLSNLIIGHVQTKLDRAEEATIYVGGLPRTRAWPFEYQAPFSPADVIEEYVRPARMRENGRIVVKPALSEPELMIFAEVGTLEAFNTDGLRTLLQTTDIPNMREKTLRYPGHADLMRMFRETGFFDKTPIEVGGGVVRPLDVTSKLLFARWAYQPGEEEFTVLRVIVEGVRGGCRERYVYDLYDKYDRAKGISSMARTTAFPAVIVARMLAQGKIRRTGVTPPELLPREPGVFEHLIEELRERGVTVHEKAERVK
jgi:saccharopine dehydrogenase-like NADP-dependent oxidoreductase